MELTPERVDLSDKTITYRALKQHDKIKYRAVPRPDTLLDAIELMHGVRKVRRSKKLKTVALWPWVTTQATKHIWALMEAAVTAGDHASPKGLRHGFGVRMAMQTRYPRLFQKLMGHSNLETTAVYVDWVGAEVVGPVSTTEAKPVRTTFNIDDELLLAAQKLTGIDEKTVIVREDLIARESARRLAKLGGTVPELKDIPRRRPAK